MGKKEIEVGKDPKRFGTIEVLEVSENRIFLRSPAKVNLFLNVLGKRKDGYHEIETVMQAVSLWDDIAVEIGGEGVRVFCSDSRVPTDEGNIVWKAATMFMEEFGIGDNIRIEIAKRIPVGAGLGGGSGNAAATLVGLNLLFDIGAGRGELSRMGSAIGCDVPFFLSPGTAVGCGKGDEIEDLPHLDIWMVLLYPGYSLSTASIYGMFGNGGGKASKVLDPFLEAIREGSIERISELVHNSLEEVVISSHPEVGSLKDFILEAGALCASISGSGPTVFGIVKGEDHASEVLEKVRGKGVYDAYIVRSI